MGLIRIASFTLSVDGYGAGPEQSLAAPMGRGTGALHAWAFATRTFRQMFGAEGGSEGEDDRLARRGFENVGAWVLGRNMFTHERGAWQNEDWKGWWGDVPPYHCPVFVVTHFPRPAFELGGTQFHFTPGFDQALALARAAAGPRDVRIGGGVSLARQALLAGVVDEMHLAISPLVLGGGEPFWPGIDLAALGLGMPESIPTAAALHLLWRRSGAVGAPPP